MRRLTAADAEDLFAVYRDPVAMRFVDDGQPIVWDDCVRWIDVTLANYRARGYGMSAVVLLETGQVIGFCGLVHPSGQLEPEVKYAFLASVWGRGLATEVVRGMLAYGSREFGMRRVIATTSSENSASHRVLEKVGMTFLEAPKHSDGSLGRTFVWFAEAAS